MGIRGLTTFINNRSHLYLKDYELHDCNVVIDGNSLASNLYKWHCKSNDCFGGDYDKFSHVIRNFFNLLSQCCITPYVILDGGYEKRKLNTVKSRMQNKIWAANSLNAVTEGSESVFPLFLREVFVDVVLSLGLKVARCQYEGDMEIAGIAKKLECPVISYDSDFYVFGCLYIPFSTVELCARKNKDKLTKSSYTYLSCKIYHIENFLTAFGGLDKNNLPLLAVLLGNDYIKGSLFQPFFRNLKIQKCSGNQSDQQKRIKSVIVWLQNEDVETAIQTILGRFKNLRRQLVLKKIKAALKAYSEVNCELLKYLDIKSTHDEDCLLDVEKLNICSVEENSDGKSDSSQTETDSDTDSISETDDSIHNTLPEIFHKNYRSCQYPACFMDMINLHRYYCIPQVEDLASKHSHAISLNILNVIYKILTPGVSKRLTIVHRCGKTIRYASLPRVDDTNIPTLEDIEKLSVEDRKLFLLNTLSVDNKFSECIKFFPTEWHLFLISIKYAACNRECDTPLIYSCLICFIILHYVDTNIGFYRVSKTFDKKFSHILSELKTNNCKTEFVSFDKLPFNDCLIFMNKMIAYFQMDAKLKTNYRMYDKTLVHSLSQIQSVFLHIKYLNSILNNPFPLLQIHTIFDGTFIYNMTINLRKRTDMKDYLEVFLKECPCIFSSISEALNKLCSNFDCVNVVMKPMRKQRRKKKNKINCDSEDIEHTMQNEETDVLIDPNNPYSVLACI